MAAGIEGAPGPRRASNDDEENGVFQDHPQSQRAETPAQLVLDIDRVFEAPRALLFRLWSAPEHIVRWWGPRGLYLSHCEMDFREGGKWRFCMHDPKGADYWISGVYREIRAPERLSFSYVGDVAQNHTVVDIDFIDLGARTRIRFRQAPFPTEVSRDDHNWGWSSTLDLLAAYLGEVDASAHPAGPPRRERVAAEAGTGKHG